MASISSPYQREYSLPESEVPLFQLKPALSILEEFRQRPLFQWHIFDEKPSPQVSPSSFSPQRRAVDASHDLFQVNTPAIPPLNPPPMRHLVLPRTAEFPMRHGSLFPTPEERAHAIFFKVNQRSSASGLEKKSPWEEEARSAAIHLNARSSTEKVAALLLKCEKDLEDSMRIQDARNLVECSELIFQIDDLLIDD